MVEKIDLKNIEKNVLKTAHDHGLFDFMMGFIVMGMAFGPVFRESLPSPYKYFLWPLILIITASIFILIVFKFVIQPRTGIFKAGPSLKSTGRKLLIVILVQFTIQLIFIVLLITGSGPGIQVSGILFILIVGLFFMPIIAIIAYLMKYPRVYLIGILIWLAIFINEILYDPLDYRIRWLLSFGVIGCIILIMGLVIFIRFLKKYPLPKEEMS